MTRSNTLGSRLRAERERLGLSQVAFGQLGGVKKLTQLKYEQGVRQPNIDYFDSLRSHDIVDVHYLLTGLSSAALLAAAETIAKAIAWIEESAASLRETASVGGFWAAETEDARAVYTEMLRLAADLRSLLPQPPEEAR